MAHRLTDALKPVPGSDSFFIIQCLRRKIKSEEEKTIPLRTADLTRNGAERSIDTILVSEAFLQYVNRDRFSLKIACQHRSGRGQGVDLDISGAGLWAQMAVS